MAQPVAAATGCVSPQSLSAVELKAPCRQLPQLFFTVPVTIIANRKQAIVHAFRFERFRGNLFDRLSGLAPILFEQ